MSPLTALIVTALSISAVIAIAEPIANEKVEKPHRTCQEFTQGLTFNDTQAIGTWHLLHYRTERTNGSGDSHCVQFSTVNDQDRNELKELIGNFVENLKWESLTLKMQIPCASLNANKSRDYYLERLEGDGSYRTLQMPAISAKMDLSDLHRYPMRLKIIENQYLGMMDCHEKFVFILGKQPPEGKDIDDRLKKMIEVYWPEEYFVGLTSSAMGSLPVTLLKFNELHVLLRISEQKIQVNQRTCAKPTKLKQKAIRRR